VATPLGAERAVAAATWRGAGPLAFASSDTAADSAGWFEGAMVSGLQAAENIAAFLTRH
jgi:monoamine oxidase